MAARKQKRQEGLGTSYLAPQAPAFTDLLPLGSTPFLEFPESLTAELWSPHKPFRGLSRTPQPRQKTAVWHVLECPLLSMLFKSLVHPGSLGRLSVSPSGLDRAAFVPFPQWFNPCLLVPTFPQTLSSLEWYTDGRSR